MRHINLFEEDSQKKINTATRRKDSMRLATEQSGTEQKNSSVNKIGDLSLFAEQSSDVKTAYKFNKPDLKLKIQNVSQFGDSSPFKENGVETSPLQRICETLKENTDRPYEK